MREIKRVACLMALVLLAAGLSSATPILVPETFTLTYTPAGGPVQLAPGGTNSLPILWNFFAIPGWEIVQSIDSVEFNITLALGDPQRPSSFTLQLSDTLSTLMGPRTLVNSGTPGPSNTFTHTALITDPTVLNAFLLDGVVNTLLARDPGFGQVGGQTNSFLFVGSTINVNAQVTPEPATYMLIGTGLAAAALFRRKRR